MRLSLTGLCIPGLDGLPKILKNKANDKSSSLRSRQMLGKAFSVVYVSGFVLHISQSMIIKLGDAVTECHITIEIAQFMIRYVADNNINIGITIDC